MPNSADALGGRHDPTMSKRLKLGDLFELRLSNGRLAYIQYVHHHWSPPRYGPVIRVLEGQHSARPEDMTGLVDAADQFVATFPLGAALQRGLLTFVGNYPVPERFDTFPLFRTYNENLETGLRKWFLWDGVRTWQIDGLPPHLRELPLRGTINYTLLEERVLSGWKSDSEI